MQANRQESILKNSCYGFILNSTNNLKLLTASFARISTMDIEI